MYISEVSHSTSPVNHPSVDLDVKSLSLNSTLHVTSTSSSMVVAQSSTNNDGDTRTTTQLLTCSQSINNAGM